MVFGNVRVLDISAGFVCVGCLIIHIKPNCVLVISQSFLSWPTHLYAFKVILKSVKKLKDVSSFLNELSGPRTETEERFLRSDR